jgi:hypothetical protein
VRIELPIFRTANAPITIHSGLYAGTRDAKNSKKKQVSDRASAKRTAMSGKTFVLMANAGSQNEFFASHICSKNQAELQRRDSRPTAMMRRHDQMAPRDRNCNDTALLERSSAARTVVRTAQRRVKIALIV